MDQFYFESGYIEDKYFVYVAAGASALSSTATVTVTAGKILGTTVNFTGVFASTMTVNAVKNGGIVVTATFTQSAAPVANRSTSLTLDNIANLASQADKLHSTASSSMAAASTLTAEALDVIQAQATFPAVTASVFTSRYFGTPRPRDATLASGSYNTSIKKFGSASLNGTLYYDQGPTPMPRSGQDFAIEFWIRNHTFGASGQYVFLQFGGLSPIRFRRAIASNTLTVERYIGSGSYTTLVSGSSGNPNQWNYIVLLRNSTRYSLYLNGTRISTSTADVNIDFSEVEVNEYTISADNYLYLDDISYHLNTNLGLDADSSSISVPSFNERENLPNNTVFLYHLNSDALDDISVNSFFAANLQSSAQITASGNKFSSAESNLTAAFTQTTDALASKEATADLATTVALTAQGDKLVEASADLVLTVTQTADNIRIRPFDSTLSAVFDDIIVIGAIRTSSSSQLVAFESTIVVNANKVGETQLQTTATISVTAEKTAGLFSDVNAVFTQSTLVTRTRPFDSSLNAAFTSTIVGNKLLQAQSDLASAFTQTTDADKFRAFGIDLSATVTQTTVGVKTADAVSNQNSAFQQTTDALRFVGLEAAFSSAFTQSTLEERIRPFDAGIAATTDTAISAVKTATASSTQTAQFTQLTLAVKTVDAIVQEDVIASQITVIALIANKESQLSATSSLTAVIGKIVQGFNTQIFGVSLGQDQRFIEYTDNSLLPASFQQGQTISFWMLKRDNDSSGYIIESMPGSLPSAYADIRYENNTTLVWFNLNLSAPNTSLELRWNNSIPTDKEWHHYMLVMDNVESNPGALDFRLYVDGQYIDYSTKFGNTAISPGRWRNPLQIGGSRYFSGDTVAKVDLAQLWIGNLNHVYTDEISNWVDEFYQDGYVNLGESGQIGSTLPFVYEIFEVPYSEKISASSGSITDFFGGYPVDGIGGHFIISVSPVLNAFLIQTDLPVISNLTCSPNKIVVSVIDMLAQSELTAIVGSIKPAELLLSSTCGFAGTAIYTAGAASTQSSDFALTAQAGDLDSAEADLAAVFELECQAVVIDPTRASALLQAETTLTADAESIFNNTANLSTTASLSADATLIPPIRVEANLQVTASLSATIGSIEQFAVLVMSAGTMTVTAEALKDAFVPLESEFTQTAIAQRRFRSTTAGLQVQGFQLTAGDIINLDPALTLTIKAESRLLTILPETRQYNIASETRTLIITKG